MKPVCPNHTESISNNHNNKMLVGFTLNFTICSIELISSLDIVLMLVKISNIKSPDLIIYIKITLNISVTLFTYVTTPFMDFHGYADS